MSKKGQFLVTEEQLQLASTMYKHTVSVKDADNAVFTIIFNDKNKTAITLITCKKNSNDKHLVYIGYLVDKGTY